MGSVTWVNYGIGVCTSDLKIKSTKAVAKLISLAPDFKEHVKQVFADCDIAKPKLGDYLELDEDYQNCRFVNDVLHIRESEQDVFR